MTVLTLDSQITRDLEIEHKDGLVILNVPIVDGSTTHTKIMLPPKVAIQLSSAIKEKASEVQDSGVYLYGFQAQNIPLEVWEDLIGVNSISHSKTKVPRDPWGNPVDTRGF